MRPPLNTHPITSAFPHTLFPLPPPTPHTPPTPLPPTPPTHPTSSLLLPLLPLPYLSLLMSLFALPLHASLSSLLHSSHSFPLLSFSFHSPLSLPHLPPSTPIISATSHWHTTLVEGITAVSPSSLPLLLYLLVSMTCPISLASPLSQHTCASITPTLTLILALAYMFLFRHRFEPQLHPPLSILTPSPSHHDHHNHHHICHLPSLLYHLSSTIPLSTAYFATPSRYLNTPCPLSFFVVSSLSSSQPFLTWPTPPSFETVCFVHLNTSPIATTPKCHFSATIPALFPTGCSISRRCLAN